MSSGTNTRSRSSSAKLRPVTCSTTAASSVGPALLYSQRSPAGYRGCWTTRPPPGLEHVTSSVDCHRAGDPDGHPQPGRVSEQLLDRDLLEPVGCSVDQVGEVRPHRLVPCQNPFLHELADQHGGERLADRAEEERGVGRDGRARWAGGAIAGQMDDAATSPTATAAPGIPWAAMRCSTQLSIPLESFASSALSSDFAAAAVLGDTQTAASAMTVSAQRSRLMEPGCVVPSSRPARGRSRAP